MLSCACLLPVPTAVSCCRAGCTMHCTACSKHGTLLSHVVRWPVSYHGSVSDSSSLRRFTPSGWSSLPVQGMCGYVDILVHTIEYWRFHGTHTVRRVGRLHRGRLTYVCIVFLPKTQRVLLQVGPIFQFCFRGKLGPWKRTLMFNPTNRQGFCCPPGPSETSRSNSCSKAAQPTHFMIQCSPPHIDPFAVILSGLYFAPLLL